MKPVLVEWEDSHHRAGWTTDAPEAVPLVVHSMGWLVANTKEAVVICANMSQESEPQRCGDMTIPRRCIIRIRDIEISK